MRTTFRAALVALLSALALSAVAATAAQAATEGPFYKIAGARLAGGESKEVKAKATVNYRLYDTLGPLISCTTQKFASGAKLLGSTGATSGSGEATVEFSGCSLSGDGTPCSVEQTVKTEPLKTGLVYLGEKRSGKVGIDFTPASKHTFAEIKLIGSGCKYTKLKIEGSLAGELYSGAKAIEVGKEPAEAATESLSFPGGPGSSVWSEVSGTLVEAEPVLEVAGTITEIYGESSLELAGGGSWGVFA
jgi:hypothetical protein